MTYSAKYISDRDARAIRATLYGLPFMRRKAFIDHMMCEGAPGIWIKYGQAVHAEITQAERRQQQLIIARSATGPLRGVKTERPANPVATFDANWKLAERKWKTAAACAVGLFLIVVVLHFDLTALLITAVVVGPIAVLTYPRKACLAQNR